MMTQDFVKILFRDIKKGDQEAVRAALNKHFPSSNKNDHDDNKEESAQRRQRAMSIAALRHQDTAAAAAATAAESDDVVAAASSELLIEAVQSHQEHILSMLLNEFDLRLVLQQESRRASSSSSPPLLAAALLDNDVAVRCFLDAGCDMSVTHAASGRNLFHVLAMSGSTALFDFVLNDTSEEKFCRAEKMRLLLQRETQDGQTPLHVQAMQNMDMLFLSLTFFAKNMNKLDDPESANDVKKQLQQELVHSCVLLHLLEFNDLSTRRVREIFAVAVGPAIGVDVTSRNLPNEYDDEDDDDDDDVGVVKKNAAADDDGKKSGERLTTLLHRIVEFSSEYREGQVAPLLRCALEPHLVAVSSNNKKKGAAQQQQHPIHAARWLSQVKDTTDVDVLETALLAPVDPDTLDFLLSLQFVNSNDNNANNQEESEKAQNQKLVTKLEGLCRQCFDNRLMPLFGDDEKNAHGGNNKNNNNNNNNNNGDDDDNGDATFTFPEEAEIFRSTLQADIEIMVRRRIFTGDFAAKMERLGRLKLDEWKEVFEQNKAERRHSGVASRMKQLEQQQQHQGNDDDDDDYADDISNRSSNNPNAGKQKNVQQQQEEGQNTMNGKKEKLKSFEEIAAAEIQKEADSFSVFDKFLLLALLAVFVALFVQVWLR